MKRLEILVRLFILMIIVCVVVTVLFSFIGSAIFASDNPNTGISFSPHGQSIGYKLIFSLFLGFVYGGISGFIIGLFSIVFFGLFWVMLGELRISIWSMLSFCVLAGIADFLCMSLIFPNLLSDWSWKFFTLLFIKGFISGLVPLIFIKRYLDSGVRLNSEVGV